MVMKQIAPPSLQKRACYMLTYPCGSMHYAADSCLCLGSLANPRTCACALNVFFLRPEAPGHGFLPFDRVHTSAVRASIRWIYLRRRFSGCSERKLAEYCVRIRRGCVRRLDTRKLYHRKQYVCVLPLIFEKDICASLPAIGTPAALPGGG